MLNAVEPTQPAQNAAWTSRKTLHIQTKDLSPRLTQDVRAEHLELSNSPEPSPSSRKGVLARIWMSVQRRRWTVLAVIAIICRFGTLCIHVEELSWADMSALRQVYAFSQLYLLTCQQNARRKSRHRRRRLSECKELQHSTASELKGVQYAPTRTDPSSQVSYPLIYY